MAKAPKLSAAVVAGQESLSAAVARVETNANQTLKDQGVIESGVTALREKVDALEDELAETKETADKTIFEMKQKYEAKIVALAGQNAAMSNKLQLIAGKVNEPLVNA